MAFKRSKIFRIIRRRSTKKVIECYYDSHSDLDNVLEFDDYKITIHD